MSKPQLREFASNTYSQLGEDGMLEQLLKDVGVRHETCAEFGAWDGLFCSNTARLWKDNHWKSIQIEPDPDRFQELKANTSGYDVVTKKKHILPSNINFELPDIGPLDVLSIDVDGFDYELFDALTLRPRIVIIEYNQSVPPHMEIRQVLQEGDFHSFSASALSVKKLAERKGYRVAGRSETNLFLVEEHEVDPADFYETEWEKMFSWDEYTYLITDMAGRTTFVGRGPYWGHAVEPLTYALRTEGEQPPWRKYLDIDA